MSRSRTIAATALAASVALHLGTGGGLVYLSQSPVEQGGGDTPMDVSIDPTAASGGSGPPIDAGPAGPPPQMAEAPPQETVKTSEPPTEAVEQPPPPEEKPQEVKPTTQEAKPPAEEPRETSPSAEREPPPPVIKSAPDTDTAELVASEPPPHEPEQPKPKPKPKPKPPQQQAMVGGAAGGATATGRERTATVGTAAVRGAEESCATRARSRLRKPLGFNPRAFKGQIYVASSGAIVSVRLLSSSGSPATDQAAIRAMQSSGPFPPCPGIAGVMHMEMTFQKSR